MSQSLRRAIRGADLPALITPPDVLRQHEANRQAVDVTGGLRREAVAPYLPPLAYRFFLSGAVVAGQTAGAHEVQRGGTLVRLAAHAATVPTAPCVVELRDGVTGATLAEVALRAGQATNASEALAVPLATRQWVVALVLAPGGAANLSIVATEALD